MSLAWVVTGTVFGVAKKSAYHWAIFNIMLITGAALYSWRGTGPDFLTHSVCNLTSVIGMSLLRRGILIFTQQKLRDNEQLVLVLIVTSVNVLYPYLPNGWFWAFMSLSLLWTYSLGRAGYEAYLFLRKEFNRSHSIATVAPLAIMSILFSIRSAIAMTSGYNEFLDFRHNSSFNAIFMLTAIFMVLSLNTSLAGLVIARLIAKIHRLSTEDSLTHVSNRRHIEQIIGEEIKKAKVSNQPLSLVILDVDHFKKVNDMYGHAAGDQALVLCAVALQNSIYTTEYLGRIGGEEFCIVLPNTTVDEANTVAERMREALQKEALIWEGKRIPLTASFGVVSYSYNHTRESEITISDLMKKADHAMYAAKKAGRNCVIKAS
jgi:diguanylate cyclase (GGDEF)-like protein